MQAKGIIFDLDGTLLDTLKDIADSANAALQAAGCPTLPVDAYRLIIGEGMDRLVEQAAPAGTPEAVQARLVEAVKAEYGRRWRDATRPYPGILELLAALAARGVPMAVLSNKPHPFTLEVVASFFPGMPFAGVRGAGPDTPLKPDPAGALSLARTLGFAPSELLMVGDTRIDVATGLNAGLFAVGVLWGFRGREELLAAGAQTIIARPEELLGLV